MRVSSESTDCIKRKTITLLAAYIAFILLFCLAASVAAIRTVPQVALASAVGNPCHRHRYWRRKQPPFPTIRTRGSWLDVNTESMMTLLASNTTTMKAEILLISLVVYNRHFAHIRLVAR